MNIIQVFVEVLKAQFTMGLGNAIVTLVLLVIPFGLGISSRTFQTKLIASIVISIIFIALSNGIFGQYAAAYPIGAVVFGLMLYIIPFVMGLLLNKKWVAIMNEVAAEENQKVQQAFNKLTNSEIVGRIESTLNSTIGVNHEWIKRNWHQLTDDEKLQWVSTNRSALVTNVSKITNSIEMIEFMQRLSREKSKSAS